MKIKRNAKLRTLADRKATAGRLFILPWLIGIVLFFVIPFFTSIVYSFNELSFGTGGNLDLKFIGLDNFTYAFTKDPDYMIVLGRTVVEILYKVPIIVLFAMFVALILNNKFRGRTFFRAVFFLPVIVTSGVIIYILNQDAFSGMISSGNSSSAMMFQSSGLSVMLIEAKIPTVVTGFITTIINNIFNLTWKSGVQILLFIAALKTISPVLYEAAKVEGASGWETFWKITFPMVSPILFANVIYTIIDSFTDYNNYIIQMINNAAFKQIRYGYSSAIAWIYFLVVFVIIAVFNFTAGKKVFYQ